MRPRRFSSERSGIPDSLLSAPSLSHWVSLLTPIFPDAPDDKCRGIGGSMARLIKGLETKLIHAGEPEPLIGGAVTMPIFQSSTYEYAGQTSYHDLRYIRLNNTPNHAVLHAKLAALENAELALVSTSGMAAISATLLTVLAGGGHLLAQDCVYGGTHDLFVDEFPRYGLSVDFIDGDEPGIWREALRPNTKAIYVEAISTPLLRVSDLQAAVDFAAGDGVLSI